MALSPEQLVLTAEIVRETYTSVVSATSSLNVAQESLLSDDIDLWEQERNSADLKFKGDGVDLDSTRLLADIFYRVRNMLGYPFIPYDLNGPVMDLIELEVGQNFG
jgi:hypothetical protein